ncbi:ATP-binding protein [candidate division KSB1 bacterium]|nr:ATP-binding protein [candidate division KSB1 bacterium]
MSTRRWPQLFLPKALRTSRSLKGKIFLALAATVLLAIISIFLVLNYFLRRQIFETLHDEVRRAARLFVLLQQRESVHQMLERSRLLTSAPQLKAALDTGHPLTVQDVLEPLFQSVFIATEENNFFFSHDNQVNGGPAPRPDLQIADNNSRALSENTPERFSDLCVIYNREGKMVTAMVRFSPSSRISSEASSRFILPDSLLLPALQGRERVAIWQNQHGAWWGVLVPIWAGGSPLGPSLLGALALGMRLDDAYALRMKALVGSEVAVVLAGEVVAVSRSDLERGQLAAAKTHDFSSDRLKEFAINDERFLATSLPWFEEESDDDVILFRSIDSSIQPLLRPVQGTLSIVGLGAFLAALVISLLVSRTITQPIAKLVDAAHAASAGQLDQPIQISSADEIGYLARRFEAMRQSLKLQMEKLTELNADLSERNLELESALDQLRRAQEELVKSEKLAAAGKLTAQLSHEINNPIHNIRSCLETALKKMPEQLAGRQFVQLAHDEILRIGKLVRQMLDFYRFGKTELQAIDLNQAIVEVLDSSQRRFEEHKIAVERRLTAGLPAVRASRDQMKQVFLNLILNAVEAMPCGGKLKVQTLKENGFVQIAIGDTGCGIPPENLPKIFDTFFTTKRAVHGVGLGLSVCYNIVHQHGGTIAVESEVGKGSTFTVKLPLAEKE